MLYKGYMEYRLQLREFHLQKFYSLTYVPVQLLLLCGTSNVHVLSADKETTSFFASGSTY